MRSTLLLAAVAAVVLATGCRTRDTVNTTPDRGGHARTIGKQTGGTATTPVPMPDEQVYTVVAGDTLMSVAKRFTMEMDDIISRNNLSSNKLTPGQNLIVKKPGARR